MTGSPAGRRNGKKSWPRFALEIEAAMKGEYRATPKELEAIDEGLRGEAASEEEVEAAFAAFRRE